MAGGRRGLTVALSLTYSAICFQTAHSLRQGLGLFTFVHLSLLLAPRPGLHTNVFSIQQICVEPKTLLDPGDPEPVSRWVEVHFYLLRAHSLQMVQDFLNFYLFFS